MGKAKSNFLMVTTGIIFLGLFGAKTSSAENPVISADFENEISPINRNIFGQGLEIPFLRFLWDKEAGFDEEKIDAAHEMGFTNVRFGGNTCKQFDWKKARDGGFEYFGEIYYEGIDEWAEYAGLLGGASLTVCVNLHLTPQDSADMVRYANLEKGYGIINWEMGNEEYIADEYLEFESAEEYVIVAREHCRAMKQADPEIKCGVHSGLRAISENWSDEALFSAIEPGDFDFLVDHNYQPNGHFNHFAIFSSGDKIDPIVEMESGIYKIGFHAIGDHAPLAEDPIPTLEVCLDTDCRLVDITGTTSDWYYYSTDNFTVGTSTGIKLTMGIFDDYYDYETKQDKNIYLADVRIVNDDDSVLKQIELFDRKEWTYSFLASNLATEEKIDYLRGMLPEYGLDLPVFETEYGWKYGNIAYPAAGRQFDWRSGLFDGLHLHSMINKNVLQANLWTDPSLDYWNFYTGNNDGIFWPRFYVFELLEEKTGDILVKTEIGNMPAYDAQDYGAGERENVPYLSVIASKRGDVKYINVINRSQDEPVTATIKVNSGYSSITAHEIAPSSIESHPYRDDEYKEIFGINESLLNADGDFEYSFKPFSITTFEILPPDTIAPVIIESSPAGQLPAGTREAAIRLVTDEIAVCRYSFEPELEFASSAYAFETTGSTTHSTLASGLEDGHFYGYYILCQDTSGNAGTEDYKISFSIAEQPPQSSGGGGGSGSPCNITPAGSEPADNAIATTSDSDGFKEEEIEILGTEYTEYAAYESLYGLPGELANLISQYEAETVFTYEENTALSGIELEIFNKIVKPADILPDEKRRIAFFIAIGTPTTLALGSGERAGVLNSCFSAFGSFPETAAGWQDAVKIANGRWPSQKSETAEKRAGEKFKEVYLREPDMNDAHDNAAVTIIAYGLRPAKRNASSEKEAIMIFKNIYGHDPASALDWDLARAIAYSGARR